MIYFIDEDHRKLRALVSELSFRGFEGKVIRDADTAFLELCDINKDEIDLVIIDVMLAAKDDAKTSKFTREKTDDYHRTGVLLLDHLVKCNPDVFPKYAVYFTHATNSDLVQYIILSADKHEINMLKKKDYDTAYEFGDEIERIVTSIKED